MRINSRKEVELFQLDIDNYITQSVSDDVTNNSLWPAAQPENYSGVDVEPTKAEILLQLGVLYWRRGSFERSEQLITKAREVSEDEQNIRFLAQCFIGLALVKTSLDKAGDAIAAYEQAITLAPEDFHLWNNLGCLYSKDEKFEQALASFKEALKITPDDIVAWNGLANTYYQNGSVDESIKAYKRAIDLIVVSDLGRPSGDLGTPETNKYFVLPWLRLAVLYTKKCQYQKALDSYLKALAFDAENAEAWNEIGALYIKMESYEKALEALSKAVEINPRCGLAYLNLAHVFTILGKNKKSETLKVISSSQDMDTWFYYKYNEEITSVNLSYVVENPEQYAKKTSNKIAIREKNISSRTKLDETGERKMPSILPVSSEKSLQEKLPNLPVHPLDLDIESTDPNTWIEKGNIHFGEQSYEEAIVAYNKAIKINPTFGQPYNNLALIHFMQGNYDKAVLLYQEGITLLATKREKAIAWNGLGNVYRGTKDYKNARIAYQNASKLDKTNGGVYENTITFEVSEKYKTADFWNDLGCLFFKAGAYNKAAMAFQKAIRLEPSSGHSYGHLARAQTAQGQYNQAVSLYHKSIDLISNNKDKANVWNRLGDVHRKLNDYDNALKAYQNGTALTDNKASLLSRTRRSLLSNCTAK